MKNSDCYSALESDIGYVFRDRSLLVRALTHSSYAHDCAAARDNAAARDCGLRGDAPLHNESLHNEPLHKPLHNEPLHKPLHNKPPHNETLHKPPHNETLHNETLHNETLEFLGDAIVGFVIAEHLWRLRGSEGEGDLTRRRAAVVRESSLADCARRLGLGALVRLGRSSDTAKDRDKPSILSDAMEALLAAVYLDGGMENARDVALRCLGGELACALEGDALSAVDDYKTQLQEKLHMGHVKDIRYSVVRATGPDHDKRFVSQVSAGGKALGTGAGRSKKESEQRAARAALERITSEVAANVPETH